MVVLRALLIVASTAGCCQACASDWRPPAAQPCRQRHPPFCGACPCDKRLSASLDTRMSYVSRACVCVYALRLACFVLTLLRLQCQHSGSGRLRHGSTTAVVVCAVLVCSLPHGQCAQLCKKTASTASAGLICDVLALAGSILRVRVNNPAALSFQSVRACVCLTNGACSRSNPHMPCFKHSCARCCGGYMPGLHVCFACLALPCLALSCLVSSIRPCLGSIRRSRVFTMCGLVLELPCGWCLPLPVSSSGAAGVLGALESNTVHARALAAACIPEAATLYAAGVLWRTLPVYAPFAQCITAVCWLG